MPVNLSIKNVPDELADRLRRRADAAHRSMQGELMAILEAALEDRRPMSPREILARLDTLDLRTEREAADDLRRERDARRG
jgi:plasmid stability protein